MDLRSLFGERVRALSEERGWSQEELGSQAGLHRTYVGAVERGERNVSLSTLEAFASALDVSVVDLLSKGTPARRK